MKRFLILSVCILLISVSVSNCRVARFTQILAFLNSNVATDPGSAQQKLHAAYYGAEILNMLHKARYIQSGILSASAFTSKLAFFTSELQLHFESEPDFGGFQSFINEKRDYEKYDEQLVSTVVNSYHAGKVLHIASSALGSGDNYLDRVNVDSALQFLAKCKNNNENVHALHPSGPISVTSALYGDIAEEVWGKPTKNAKAAAYLQKCYREKEGGFAHDTSTESGSLRATYEALVLLHRSGALASFLSTGSHKADLIRFIDSFYPSSTHSFAETPKMTGDIVSTYYGIHSLSLIGGGGKVDVNANAKQIAEFVNGLQDRNGGFKLRAGSSQSGHYVNTYYALKILQELNKASVLETAFDEPEVIVREVVFIPINTIYLLVAVFLLGFGLVLYLLTREKEKEEKEDDEGEEGEAAEGKGKGKNKGKARKEESKTSEDSEEEKKNGKR